MYLNDDMICHAYQKIRQDTLQKPIAISKNYKHQVFPYRKSDQEKKTIQITLFAWYIKVCMKWNIIAAYLKGPSKKKKENGILLFNILFHFRDIDVFVSRKLGN